MNQDKHENFPDNAEDWDKIAQDFSQDSVSIEPGRNLTLFASIPEDLLLDGNISMQAKVLYTVYHSYMIKGKSFVGRETLAKSFKGQKGNKFTCTKSISRWTKELEDAGWIKVKRGLKRVEIAGKSKLIETNLVELLGKKIRKK